MADVNINNACFEDQIGDLSVEGFTQPKIVSSLKRTPKNLIGSVYPGETLLFATIVKRNSCMDTELWKKCISRVTGEASVHDQVPDISNKKKGLEDEKTATGHDSCQNDRETGMSCQIVATFVGTNSKSRSNLAHDFSDLTESSFKPHFRDENTYVIPMTLTLENIKAVSHFIELQIVLWLYTISVQTSESSPEPDLPTAAHDTVNNNKVDESAHPRKTRIRVVSSEFFDAESDDDEAASKNKQHISNGDAEAPHVSSSQVVEKTSEMSPVKVSSSSCSVQQKTVVKTLQVQATPNLRVQHSIAGQKQLIILTVNNNAEKQMVIKNINLLSSASPVQDINVIYEERENLKWDSCHHLIKLESPRKSLTFPLILAPSEQLNLIYRLLLSSVPSESEMSLRASVKWTHAGATNEITTIYRLPTIRIRSPPFIVTIKCEEEVELGKTFHVTYTISNQLHDFMRMRLYYNLENMRKAVFEKGGTEKERAYVENLSNAVICHDPDIAISSCPRGSCVPVRVGFQIHKPGVYEMSEMMKVNLQYSFPETPHSHHPSPLPPSHTHGQQHNRHHNQFQANNSSSSSISATSEYGASSSSSPSLQSTDDPDRQSLLASEELWRGRSGSTTSLATPPPASHKSAEERRRSFASKSYSFGDLGPTASADSDQGDRHNHKPIKRSPAVPSSRPPPPRMLSQTERDLVRPSNFLKQPFYIHVKDPHTII
ncbi:chromosome 7 open reading frame 43 [Plakobranchus ocellatus]|uniref:Chromosome 7 open reading frame 43 n=1 Tax=Plakobranchus ocellatus TaxID=259542 RepID=A0AAV3ZTJ8_9GAST|nr:chromosome 7 open reading frame 43 [Plakobranchus ocellatus]